ncbi:hypothetical protein Ddc_07826 [Ditylenchus destructor]|nr:hypothetical protein Ddc_07826 [Ditylenchus destructor]
MLLLRSTLCAFSSWESHPTRCPLPVRNIRREQEQRMGSVVGVYALSEAVALCNIDCQQCEQDGGSTPAVTYFPSNVQGPKERGNR